MAKTNNLIIDSALSQDMAQSNASSAKQSNMRNYLAGLNNNGMSESTSIPLSLYIHIPWCIKKCPYCDFNSHVMKNNKPVAEIEDEYVDALLADLRFDIERFGISRPIQTIFFGGGTPSLFSDAAINKILSGANALLSFAENIEITLETNPGAAEINYIKGYQQAGVNRISLGIQSFQDHYLQKLGRVHDYKEALKAIDMVANIGFKQWNIDLMFGLPEQSISDAKLDIAQILACAPPHVSAYQMTIEPNTTFAVKPPKLPSDDTLERIHDIYTDALNNAGYSHYEVSAHAKTADNTCRHNVNYWQFGDYLGIGAGAHSKLSFTNNTNSTSTSQNKIEIVRCEKTPSPSMYMNAAKDNSFSRKIHPIDTADLLLEYGMNALRLESGFAIKDFTERTGLSTQALTPFIEQCQQYQWLEVSETQIKPTTNGRLFLNSMLDMLSEIKS